MPEATNKVFLCKVQKCPMEKDVPADDKYAHQDSMKRSFGDDFKIVNCEKVLDKEGKALFCEMVVRTQIVPLRSNLPDGLSIVMEVEQDV